MNYRAIAFVGFTCLSACASLSSDQVRYEGAVFRQLMGEQLRSAIQGKQLTFPDDQRGPVITSWFRCHRFHVLGYYMSCRHRANLHGTYDLSHDRVCASTGTCWALYSSSDGRFLLRALSPTPAPPDRVSIVTLPELNRQ